ncbi:SLAC1 anion channel family protein [Lacibacter sediminis]|uniref:SLAC1 anion channel family protein n=1 Tax=Lacibacter sediminis TaxID=2760713 RepID=A0A7G5XKB3_9BACT|nr:SLAC1 anion channel family protein [Lacibacter sediminis]QNA45916.1 SLAC1 anion channel family protein [Lacibacter sediminis]
MNAVKHDISFLQFLPVSLFGGILGLTGLSFSWRLASAKWGLNPLTGAAFGAIVILLFLLLLVTYINKWIRFPQSVKAEFKDFVSVAFFATFIVSLLLIPGILLTYHEGVATVIWLAGVVFIIIFNLYLLQQWLKRPLPSGNILTPLLLPVIGLLDVPIVGSLLQWPAAREISLFCFAAGCSLFIILYPVIMARLLFVSALPETLQPTLLFLVLPYPILYLDYIGFSGSNDILSSVLYYSGIFLLLIFGSKILFLPKSCPFRVGWWAVSFPLTAITISAFRYSEYHQQLISQVIPVLLLALSTCTIIYLMFQTTYRILTKQLFINDPTKADTAKISEPNH